MKRYGYIRVSTKEQNPERQVLAMRAQEIEQSNIFCDRMSGQDFSRPQYLKLISVLSRGDILVIKSIDRLGRNYGEILEQWRYITKTVGAEIQVIDMPLLNMNTVQADLTGTFIADLVLQILAYVAETERSFIRQRQAEGIAAAKQRGVHFGCKKKDIPRDFAEYYQLWTEGKISLRKAAKALRMSYSTFYRRCLEQKNDEESCCK